MENKDLHVEVGGREDLLQEYDDEQKKDKNIEPKTLGIVILSMILVLCIVIPNIYIKNKIYYISRDIGKLYDQHVVLQEENRELMRKIEALQFKNQVLYPLSVEDLE